MLVRYKVNSAEVRRCRLVRHQSEMEQMAIGSIVGTTFAPGTVSVGIALLDGNNLDYTESQLFPLGSVTITSYNPVNNLVNFQYSNDLTVVTDATILGHSADAFVINAVIPSLSPTPISLYFSATAQPSQLGQFTVTLEAFAPDYVACYCEGTLIRTPEGQRPVEELRAGDVVHCLNGGTAPVRWVGERSYAGRFLRANPKLRPVRFMAGSLGDSLPERDLLVSPQHAMLIDGALVPAELLVNGSTIVRDGAAEVVRYFHIELPGHDAVWAEGVLSETFVDDESRNVFHNADSFAAMYPDAVKAAPVFFAPRLHSGPALDAIRARLCGAGTQLPAAA